MEPEADPDLPLCTVGDLNNSKCHLTFFSNSKKGFKLLKEFQPDQQRLLILRSGHDLETESTICFHHEALLLSRFEFLQKHCCNPFSKANHKAKKGLRVLDEAEAVQLKNLTKEQFLPGQKLCPTCRNEMHKKARDLSSTESSDADHVEQMETAEKVNTSLSSLGISPLKFQKVSKRDSEGYAKRKICQAQSEICTEIAVSGGFKPSEFAQQNTQNQQCQNCLDYSSLLTELKQKMQISSNAEKLQILTLAPDSWSIAKVASEFFVSTRMVKKARKLKQHDGILAVPHKKKGRVLSATVKDRVSAFFEDDEFSRLCPGKKDYISVRIGSEKIQKQKRLLLCNLKEMHVAYRNLHGSEVSFSKFCTLRPKWCVTVGSSGMHSVCVCAIHQNIKLMLTSSIVDEDYKVLMSRTVCDIESKQCMLHKCEQCPGKIALEKYLSEVYSDIDSDETIEFQQWVQTDRAVLEMKQMLIEEFLADLASKIFDLSVHHFVSKHQTQYLKTVKQNLTPGEIVVLMDFAENYSFVVQDAVQGFHWENSQATLHPFVVYFCENGNLQCFSACVISDNLRHDTVAVYVFTSKLMEHLKNTLQHIRYIAYFSDGSAAQYKNYKNFTNLCYHEIDFGIKAEWNFFGTSHGKSPCDGIGGTAKRLAAHASLQRTKGNQILTADDLFQFCEQNIKNIKFLFVSKTEIESKRPAQEERFQNASTVAGTRENHQFVPLDLHRIKVSRVSNDSCSFVAKIGHSLESVDSRSLQIKDFQPGQYIACVYDSKWWVGNICEVSDEEHDALVNFMHPAGPVHSFYWPSQQDKCWVPEGHILTTLPAPATTSSGRHYAFADSNVQLVNEKFHRFNMQ